MVHLVHSLGSEAFEDADRRAAGNIARAADRAGVRQIVYLRGLGDVRLGLDPADDSSSGHGRGSGKRRVETIRALVDRLPVMVCPRWVTVPTQPIALRDVVGFLAGVVGVARASARPTTSAARRS